jgi:ABC-type transporter Mla subunit MlaD
VYEATFSRVDHAAGELLGQIAQNLRDYTQTSRQAFEGLVGVSNDLIGNAVQKLSGAISELEEYLSDLSDALSKTRPKG